MFTKYNYDQVTTFIEHLRIHSVPCYEVHLYAIRLRMLDCFSNKWLLTENVLSLK